VRDLGLGYGNVSVLKALSLPIERGKITVLAGPNGCGKSTLLRAIRRLHKPECGHIFLEEVDIARLSDKALARQIGLLAQSPSAPEDMTVEELVRLGRYPHQSMLQPWSRDDAAALELADGLQGSDVVRVHDSKAKVGVDHVDAPVTDVEIHRAQIVAADGVGEPGSIGIGDGVDEEAMVSVRHVDEGGVIDRSRFGADDRVNVRPLDPALVLGTVEG